MTNPPHGDAEPEGSPAQGPDGRPPGAGQSPAGSPPHGAHAWGRQPGAAPGGPPFGATQPYGQLPADFGPPGQVPRPPWGQQYGAPQQYGLRPAGSRPPTPGSAPYGVPGYGVPGDGGPWQPPARRRSRVGLFTALAGVAVLVGIAVLALSTGPVVLSRTAVERDVAAQFEQREGVAVDLRCTQEMTVEEGAAYQCSGVTTDDEEVTLRIEITDEDGAHYTWTEP